MRGGPRPARCLSPPCWSPSKRGLRPNRYPLYLWNVAVIPKLELRGFGRGFPYYHHHFSNDQPAEIGRSNFPSYISGPHPHPKGTNPPFDMKPTCHLRSLGFDYRNISLISLDSWQCLKEMVYICVYLYIYQLTNVYTYLNIQLLVLSIYSNMKEFIKLNNLDECIEIYS